MTYSQGFEVGGLELVQVYDRLCGIKVDLTAKIAWLRVVDDVRTKIEGRGECVYIPIIEKKLVFA